MVSKAAHRFLLTFLTLGALVMAGCTSPEGAIVDMPADDIITPESITGSTGAVGGSVRNSAPYVTSLMPDATTGENRGGFVVIFTGSVRDNNTENQIRNISMAATGPTALGSNHVVTGEERNATAEPTEFGGDGWKVWTGVKNDGVLNFKFRQTFPAFTPAGVYAFRAHVSDAPGLSGVSNAIPVTLLAFSDITISPTPVGADGTALTGQNWGEWDAEAGATNVASSNYLKFVNTGDVATSSVVIDFANTFVGADDASFTIPTASNVQFAFARSTSGAAPSTLTFNFLPANTDATVTVDFTDRDQTIYVTYRIVELPAILPVQAYGISFTVTEL